MKIKRKVLLALFLRGCNLIRPAAACTNQSTWMVQMYDTFHFYQNLRLTLQKIDKSGNMAKLKKQQYEGIVYSTDDSFSYRPAEEQAETEPLPPRQQRLMVQLDKKARKGKLVTLVKGFTGSEQDLNELARFLKQKCAVGGSAKDGEIIIQGDFRKRIQEVLAAAGYNVKILG